MTRSGSLDAVRVLALVAVVAGHVWLRVPAVHVAVFAWHVPVFFFLTGVLWRPDRSFGQEARRRFRTLGVPYLVWLALLLVAYGAVRAAAGRLSLPELAGIAAGPGATHRPFHTFWFLTALLVVALLHRLLSGLPPAVQAAVAIACGAVGTVAGRVLADLPLSIGTAVSCLPFVVAGAAAQRVLPRVLHRARTGALLVGAGVAALLLGVQPVDLKQGDVGTPVLGYLVALSMSAGLVLLAEALLDRLPAAASRVATALALPAVVVLLLHPVVLWLLRTPPSGRPLDFALCVLIPWTAGLAILRSPLAPLLAGTPRSHRRAGALRQDARRRSGADAPADGTGGGPR